MDRRRSRNAFTLVELLVVIGVIGVLLSILLPTLAKAHRAANELVCESNLRQFGFGIQTYADQNRGLLPQKGPDGSSPSQSFGKVSGKKVLLLNNVVGFDDPSIWFNAIPPLVNNKSYYKTIVDDYHNLSPLPCGGGPPSIFICPDMSSPGFIGGLGVDQPWPNSSEYYSLYGGDSTGTMMNSTGFYAKGNFKFDCSYVWNSKLASTIAVGDLNTSAQNSLKMTKLHAASEVVVMVEKLGIPQEYQDSTVQLYNNTYTANGGPFKGAIDSRGYLSNVAQPKADWRRFTTRHRHGGHLLFADGHVAWFSWTQAQIQPNEMPGNVYNANYSDANQPGVMIWSTLGPVN